MPDAGPGGPIEAVARPTPSPIEVIGGGNARPSDDEKVRSPLVMSDGDR